MEYLVIEHYKMDIFKQLVNEALAKGWELQGGISAASPDRDISIYVQALTRK